MAAYYAAGAYDVVVAAAVARINAAVVVAAADGGDVPELRNDGNGEYAAAAGDVMKEVTRSHDDLR